MHLYELRRDLQLTPVVRDGVELVVAHDPVGDLYIDLDPAQAELLALADGKTTPEEIHAALEEAGSSFTVGEVWDFLSEATARGLMTLSSFEDEIPLDWSEARRVRRYATACERKLQQRPAGAPWRTAAGSALHHLRRERMVLAARSLEEALALGAPPECRELLDRIGALHFQTLGDGRMFKLGKLLDGDPIAAALARALRWLLTPYWLVAFAASAVVATALVMTQLDRAELQRTLDPLLTTVVLLISLSLHELGHAVACRRVGGKVGKIGVGLLYYFLPIAYADVSGTYLVPDRWRRMLVGAAGILVNQTLVALAYPFMVLTEPGTAVHSVATAVVVMNVGTYVINAIPFIRLDGYYMLADLLSTPNLAHDAELALASLAMPAVRPVQGFKLWVLRAFGAGALAFKLFFFLVGLRYFYDFLGGKLGRTIAFVLAAIIAKRLLTGFILPPLRYLKAHPEALRTWRVQAALALVVGGLFAVPFPWSVTADGTVQRPHLPARTAVPGRLARLAVRDGDRVEKGQWLGALENRDLEARALAAAARLSTARSALAALEAGERPERLQAARAAMAASQAKVDAGRAGEARLSGLLSAGLAPGREAERARSDEARARAELEIRREGLRLLDEPDPLLLREARAALTAAELEMTAVERLREGLSILSPAAGRVATPLEDAEGRWYEAGAVVLEVATEERTEVAVLVPPGVPWTQLARAEALVPSAGRELALSLRQLRFQREGTAVALEAPLPPDAATLDGAAAKVRFHLGARPLAFQYAVEAARALRFELWAAELDPGWIARD